MSGSGPIYEYQRELTARLEQALRERDEARAEVKRYKGAYIEGYYRGVEAMREAAAREVCEYSVTVLNPFGERVRVNTDGLGGLGSIIRDLPIPEDK